MIDSSTLKALGSTILTFAVVIAIGALTTAIGQDTTPRAAPPTATPYETVDSDPAPHNHPDRSVPASNAAHNTP
jgi:hypothetical protein